MQQTCKPVRKCYACLLNQGSHCWIYRYPRGQWRGGRHCPGFDDDELYGQYREWLKQPSVKTRKALRRGFFRKRRRMDMRARDGMPDVAGRGGSSRTEREPH